MNDDQLNIIANLMGMHPNAVRQKVMEHQIMQSQMGMAPPNSMPSQQDMMNAMGRSIQILPGSNNMPSPDQLKMMMQGPNQVPDQNYYPQLAPALKVPW